MPTPDHIASEPSDQDSVPDPAPNAAATSGVRAEPPVVGGTASQIMLAWMWMVLSVPLGYRLILLWAGWRESRAVAQPDGGM